MTAKELQEWEIDNALSPWGEDRKDWRAAQGVAATVAQYAKRSPRISDFMYDTQNKPRQTEAEMKAEVARIQRHREAREARKKKRVDVRG